MKTLDLQHLNCIYFLGIGGIGMSALAHFFLQKGTEVHGYDLTPSPITDELMRKGAVVHFEEDVDAIPPNVDLVVYTPAIEEEHLEYLFFKTNSTPMCKRAEMLGYVSRQFPNIAVAGTHGKTTTTAMISHIFHKERNIMAFIGGVAKNFSSNFVLDDKVELVIEEADEFDRSFLQLNPDLAVITAVEADHLDVYEKKEELEATFQQFAQQIRQGGPLIIFDKDKDKIAYPNKYSYGFSEEATYRISDVKLFPNSSTFSIDFQRREQFSLSLGIPGLHNVLNATASFAVAHQWMLSPAVICKKIERFAGVKRRFDYVIDTPELKFIDDYAHHPEELRALFHSVRKIYPDKKITAVFQPHLYTRTRDFMEQFAEVLALPDCIILLDIYPAREQPIPGVTSEHLLSLIHQPNKFLFNKTELLASVAQQKPEILLTIGAGNIDRIVPEIEKVLLSLNQ